VQALRPLGYRGMCVTVPWKVAVIPLLDEVDDDVRAIGAANYITIGLSTGALFLCIGMIYERYHTKDTDVLGGLAKKMPVWATFMVLFTLASIGLPGLNGFIGEFLCLGGTFIAEHDGQSGYPGVLGPRFAVIAGLGLIFAAMYLLILLGKIVWGPLREPHHDSAHTHAASHASLPTDLNAREILVLTPLAVACIWLGVQPQPMLKAIEPCATRMLANYPDEVRRLKEREAQMASDAADAPNLAQVPQHGGVH